MEKIDITNKKQTEEDVVKQNLLKQKGAVPEHIAIIMDGNGRWAKERGSMRVQGHKAGVESVKDAVEACAQLGVKYLTLYAFSTENWQRPKAEISALMKLLIQSLRKETKKLNKNDLKLTAIGQLDRLPKVCHKELIEAMQSTQFNKRMQICLALSYSGRWDMTNAMQSISRKIESGELRAEEIDESVVHSHLATADIPDPDLLIRTGGEFRISNFLLWQTAYTEFYISGKYWPEFRRDDLYDGIEAFQNRERRFGMISEQVCEKQKANLEVTA